MYIYICVCVRACVYVYMCARACACINSEFEFLKISSRDSFPTVSDRGKMIVVRAKKKKSVSTFISPDVLIVTQERNMYTVGMKTYRKRRRDASVRRVIRANERRKRVVEIFSFFLFCFFSSSSSSSTITITVWTCTSTQRWLNGKTDFVRFVSFLDHERVASREMKITYNYRWDRRPPLSSTIKRVRNGACLETVCACSNVHNITVILRYFFERGKGKKKKINRR